jgi:hypothetical protein
LADAAAPRENADQGDAGLSFLEVHGPMLRFTRAQE